MKLNQVSSSHQVSLNSNTEDLSSPVKNKRPIGRRTRRGRRSRFGAATIELAVCLPVMILIVYGSLTGSRMVFLRQACVQAAYETVKESARTNGRQADGIARGQAVLDFRNIEGETISFEPADTDDLPRGTPIVVTVTAPSNANALFVFGPFNGGTISVQATMLKE